MLLVHTVLGCSGWKLRSSRLAAMGRLCLLSVVTTYLRLPLALMPCSFMSFWIRSFPPRPGQIWALLGIERAARLTALAQGRAACGWSAAALDWDFKHTK